MWTKLGRLALLMALAYGSSAWAQIGILSDLSHEYTVEPGRSYEGVIEVGNPSNETQEVKAYQGDYFFYANGTSDYAEPGSLPRSNAKWISFSPKQTLILPKTNTTFDFTIQVPDDGTLKGSYWSLILVEAIPPQSAESSRPMAEPGVRIVETLRYAIQIVTQVGDTGTRNLTFTQLKLVEEQGKRLLLADVQNTGEQWLRGGFFLDLYDEKGAYLGKFESPQRRMYPQTSVRYSVDLVGVPNGSFKALIVVDCGGDDVFGINANLVLKD